jgi:DnaJ homolog subfamily C member 2
MQPIPSLGDHTTPIEDVDKFYNFWYNFKSWREFSDDDEYDLEQAESPEHKRWMERQNAKLHEKAKKVEYARVHTLVDTFVVWPNLGLNLVSCVLACL